MDRIRDGTPNFLLVYLFSPNSGSFFHGGMSNYISLGIFGTYIDGFDSSNQCHCLLHQEINSNVFFIKQSLSLSYSSRNHCQCLLHQAITVIVFFIKKSLSMSSSSRNHCHCLLHQEITVIVFFIKKSLSMSSSSRNHCQCLLHQEITVNVFFIKKPLSHVFHQNWNQEIPRWFPK